MQALNISTHKDTHFEQMTISAAYTDRKALLTRFKGSRVWSVRGRSDDSHGAYSIEVAAGAQKAKALDAARWFVEFNIF